jgi:hypothetical protein
LRSRHVTSVSKVFWERFQHQIVLDVYEFLDFVGEPQIFKDLLEFSGDFQYRCAMHFITLSMNLRNMYCFVHMDPREIFTFHGPKASAAGGILWRHVSSWSEVLLALYARRLQPGGL